jgi:hypothetical protein
MKKMLIVLIIVLVFPLTACQSALNKYSSNISEIRDEVMIGESENFTVTLISGERENPFEVDGKTDEKIDFTVVTITPKHEDECEFTYRIKIGEEILSGKFTPHPFKKTYSFEVEKRTTGTAFLAIGDGENIYEINLTSVKTDNTISYSDALDIACHRLKDSIESVTVDDVLNCEIFIRYIENPISSEKAYYWYVAFAPEKYTTFATLIDTVTGEIIAVRE